MELSELAALPIFHGLEPSLLERIVARARRRRFEPHEVICRAGEPGQSMFLVASGVALVRVEHPEGSRVVARLRRGDIFGEMSLLTGEPRYAGVIAAVPTEVWELDREECAALVALHPPLLINVSRILTHRLARMNVQQFDSTRRGEAVALVVGGRAGPLVPPMLAAARATSPRPISVVDLRRGEPDGGRERADHQVTGFLATLDERLAARGRVIAVVDVEGEHLPLLLEQVDRTLAVADERDTARLPCIDPELVGQADLALLAERPGGAASAPAPWRLIRAFSPDRPGGHPAWLGRHLARTKLGLALGAGGAKGYAHIGAIQTLREAGYEIDCVAGSSIGAVVGAWLALGLEPAEIERAMRRAFTPETVEAMFSLSLSGTSRGLEVMNRVWNEAVGAKTFDDLAIPLVVMCVDLNTRLPALITSGPLDEALQAATALPGFFPAFIRGDQRLVDGMALIPVPSDAAREAGADVIIAVNIVSRETLPAWPGRAAPDPPPPRPAPRMLETLLEMIDLAQVDSSVRNASRADLVITPRFGPASWRDFHLADRFLEAGRAAAAERLPALRSLVKPLNSRRQEKGEVHGAELHVR